MSVPPVICWRYCLVVCLFLQRKKFQQGSVQQDSHAVLARLKYVMVAPVDYKNAVNVIQTPDRSGASSHSSDRVITFSSSCLQ